jgi:hypothetical protein
MSAYYCVVLTLRWSDPQSKKSYQCLNAFIVSEVHSELGRDVTSETHSKAR